MTTETLALKPYLEKIKKHCAKLTKAELIDLLCQAALDVPAAERTSFLERLSIISHPVDFEEIAAPEDSSILARKEKLLEDIADWQKSVEDGSYYEERYEEDDYYYDEEFPSMSKEQQESLEALFAEADRLFLDGKLELAQKAYQQLIDLSLHGRGLDYSIEYNEIDINWRETLARYCRCVYETSSEAERPKLMCVAMEAERKTEAEQHPFGRQLFGLGYDPVNEILPSLKDVFNARPGELADWDDFLKKLQKELRSIDSSRAVLLHLEAVQRLDGLQGLAAAVRQRNNPTGYLYWLDRLREAEAWGELAAAAQEALRAMPYDSLRAYAAAQLYAAGEQTGDNILVLQGKREQFFSYPQEEYLADLLREADKQQVREAELDKAISFLESMPAKVKQPHFFSQSDFFLRIKIMLLLGQLQESYAAIDQEAAIGWSNEKRTTGAVYVSILFVLCKGNAEAKTIQALFERYMRRRDGNGFIADEIKKRLLQTAVSDSQQKQWLKFVERISSDRAEHIVSNQYRKGYARGAEALGGYMECLILHEQQDKAAAFLELKRNQEYKRYPAFRREFDAVVSNSPLLGRL
ncbi:hypothetical protein GCAAIG_08260 [Candidatus Electronema halotolerans]